MTAAIQKTGEVKTLAQFLEVRQSHLAEVLPKSKALTPEKLIKLAVLATKKQPLLQKCSMDSIFIALLQCAELGLEPSGTLGSAYLVPYGQTCQLIIGYRGLIDLARRSGSLRQIEARVVHEKDAFKVSFGLDPKLEHTPYLDGDPGKARLVYCVAQLADGAKHVEVMTVDEVRRIENRSRGKGGPWSTDWEEMAKKTVARRACKWLPMSADLAKAFDIEGEVDHGRGPEASDVLSVEPVATASRDDIKAALRAKASRVTVEAAKEPDPHADDEPPMPSDADAPPEVA